VTLLNPLILLPWAIVAFFVVQFVAAKRFQAGDRSYAVAGAVVGAFLIGAFLPYFHGPSQNADQNPVAAREAVASAAPTPTQRSFQSDKNADSAPPVTWDEKRAAFVQTGRPLAAVRLWRFDHTTDGFSASPGSQVAALPDRGLDVTNREYGAFVRTPPRLGIDGRAYPIVLVRLTRTKSGSGWDPTLYYATGKHEESPSFFAPVYRGKNPGVGDTVTLVFNMAKLGAGGNDWIISTVNQLRLQTDDQAGGEFVIRQVAVTKPLIR
jgi:hypothetical protein